MSRVAEIRNESSDSIFVKLVGGASITLMPHTSIKNADVENLSSLRGKVKIKEDLTEVGNSTGKQRIDG